MMDEWRRDVSTASGRTHYLELGEGEPVILLHGSGPGVSALAILRARTCCRWPSQARCSFRTPNGEAVLQSMAMALRNARAVLPLEVSVRDPNIGLRKVRTGAVPRPF